MTKKGPLIIVSGASGTGKTTVLNRLLAEMPAGKLRQSVSATTRPPRTGEVDGRHYHFWTDDRFQAAVAAGEFLEHAQVHGCSYGTLRKEVEPYRDQGMGVILDIDVQGAKQIQRSCPESRTVFLRAPSLAAYEERLRKRGTESEQAVERRLQAARRELAHAAEYDHQIVNDDLDTAVAQMRALVLGFFEREHNAG